MYGYDVANAKVVDSTPEAKVRYSQLMQHAHPVVLIPADDASGAAPMDTSK
ncbi:MAG: hypothetical protein KGL39_21065 [Patescibacteria group bacterium]|nr:hypothetical protein [Patescibacteria group bacterium]